MLGILFGVPGYANQFQNRLAAVSLLSKVRMVHYKLLICHYKHILPTYLINLPCRPDFLPCCSSLVCFPGHVYPFPVVVIVIPAYLSFSCRCHCHPSMVKFLWNPMRGADASTLLRKFLPEPMVVLLRSKAGSASLHALGDPPVYLSYIYYPSN